MPEKRFSANPGASMYLTQDKLVDKKNVLDKLVAETYQLIFAKDRPFVYLNDASGKRLADLFVLSGIHPLNGRDDTVQVGSWQAEEFEGGYLFSLETESAIWQKKVYRFRCLPTRLSYEVEVEGTGWLWEVNYFGGYYSGHTRWGSGFFWSGQSFRSGFNPDPNSEEKNYFQPGEGATIKLMGVPLPGKATWFFTPPPFCFAFEGRQGWLGLGVEAQPGSNRFTEYSYHGQNQCFFLSLAFEGHTLVTGRYQLPTIGFEFQPDEYEVLSTHICSLQEHHCTGEAPHRPRPEWWYEPIFCGWGQQCYLADKVKGHAPDYSRQDLYEGFMATLAEKGIQPGTVVLDDKWQLTYGENRADPTRWPDLPGFVRQRHAGGQKVLLWLKAWDPEGVPPEECITNARGLPLAVDPTNPAFEARLRSSVRYMLSPEGYDADGFKIDFTARIPSGPGICIHGNAWGLELMKLYLQIIYAEAKRTKPDALVMTHTPHPYLADVLDMIRLNDINKEKDVIRAMSLRARIAGLACPEAIIDTDNWPVPNRSIWRKYLRLQPDLGVPSLYYVTHIDSSKEPLTPGDYQLIRQAWARYRAARKKGGRSTRNKLNRTLRRRRPALTWRFWGHPAR